MFLYPKKICLQNAKQSQESSVNFHSNIREFYTLDAPLILLKLENIGALQKLIKMEITSQEEVFLDCAKLNVPDMGLINESEVTHDNTQFCRH